MKRITCLILVLFLCAGCHSAHTTPTETQGTVAETNPETTVSPTTVSPTDSTEPEETVPVDPLIAVVVGLTIEERVGQLFLARCPDTNAISDIQKYHLGGFVLFSRDFKNETPESVRTTLASYQAASNIPMLLAVDEEGGTVTRISQFPAFRDKKFYSPRYLYAQGSFDLIFKTEEEKCQLLRSLGLNVNIGPVCDIATDKNAFMYHRSLGESPEMTGQFVQGMVQTMSNNQVGCILKHFPGYGNNADTHIGIAVDNRPLSELESIDLIPFAMGIDAGCNAIMISHIYINAIDTNLPATLSPAVHQYLRDNMGFDGVIVTDDLVMQAITDIYGVEESAVLAILAGNDLLCSTDYARQYEAVLKAVMDGRISESQLNSSVLRILRWKSALGLI